MTRRISRVWCAAAVAAWMILPIGGCRSEKRAPDTSRGTPSTAASTSSSTPHAMDPHKLSDAEFKYGMSPTKNAEVTYQRDVVLMEHGAEAIRSVSTNGLAWTLDASSPGAADIVPGKILFATNRAVGRVLGLVHKGNDIEVVLGPVALTEVIKDAKLSYDQPVDLNSMIAYSAPDYPGADGDSTPQLRTSEAPSRVQTSVSFMALSSGGDLAPMYTRVRSGGVAMTPATFTRADRRRFRALLASSRGAQAQEPQAPQAPQSPGTPEMPSLPDLPGAPPLPALPQVPAIPSTPSISPPSQVSISDFKVVPFCCGGLGMKITHQDAGVTLSAYAVLRLKSPSLRFNLDIEGGKVITAEVELRGAAGLTVQFDAYSAKGLDGNISRQFYVPVDLTIPIGGMAVPFAVTVRQTFLVKTSFSAKKSKLSAVGDYAFGGSVFMGYHQGQWGVGAPEQLSTRRNLSESISGASLGINGLVFAYGGRVIVGIGAFGFATGPYVAYNTSVGITRATDLSAPSGRICGSATLGVLLKFGIGYQMPQPVADAINFILRKINLATIESSGGLGSEQKIVDKKDVWPKGCPVPQ